MTYQERCDYREAATGFRRLAEQLKGDGYRPAFVEGARRHALAAARNLEEALAAERPEGIYEHSA